MMRRRKSRRRRRRRKEEKDKKLRLQYAVHGFASIDDIVNRKKSDRY